MTRDIQDKIPVVILGATGCVGQKFIQALAVHPWFSIAALCASERSAGKNYGEAVNWLMPKPIPSHIANMKIQTCMPSMGRCIAFSGLDSSVAGEIESTFAQEGFTVVSNARNHRMHPSVPLVVGEVNPDHLDLVKGQKFPNGGILVTNPNCSVIGITLALKPLMQFGLESVHVVTLQAVSGAGYPGVASLDIVDNVIPFISGEEEKVETEPLKILGNLIDGTIQQASLKISAQCNRVPVTDGHMACISVKFRHKPNPDDLIHAWESFRGEPQKLNLPTAPEKPIHYSTGLNHPQPKLHRHADKEMAVTIGRLRPCSLFDYKFAILSHNTMRGAVGSALLNAELLVTNL